MVFHVTLRKKSVAHSIRAITVVVEANSHGEAESKAYDAVKNSSTYEVAGTVRVS